MQTLSLSSCAAMCMIVGSATEVETLKSELAEAKKEAKASKAAADKVAADLEEEKVTCRKYEELASDRSGAGAPRCRQQV